MSRSFVALTVAVAFVFVGFGRAEAHCCWKPHKSHPVVLHPQEHCCDRAESGVLAELRKIEDQLITLKTVIETNTAEVKNVTTAVNDAKTQVVGAINDTTTEVKNVTGAVNDAKTQVVGAINDTTKEVRNTGVTLRDTIENTGRGITTAINQADDALRREVQAARNVLDALYSRPNSFSVKVGNEAVPCSSATPSGTPCQFSQ
jgi:hypothetical protein